MTYLIICITVSQTKFTYWIPCGIKDFNQYIVELQYLNWTQVLQAVKPTV